jgi:Protein of unknown function (DUF1064)
VSERMSVGELRELQAAFAAKVPKYRNKRVVLDGWQFDSKLEASRYEGLKALRSAGAVAWFLCQVPFRLPGGIIYRADFLVVWKGLGLTVEDCKGARTRVSINKIKQVEEIYGIKITMITRKGMK